MRSVLDAVTIQALREAMMYGSSISSLLRIIENRVGHFPADNEVMRYFEESFALPPNPLSMIAVQCKYEMIKDSAVSNTSPLILLIVRNWPEWRVHLHGWEYSWLNRVFSANVLECSGGNAEDENLIREWNSLTDESKRFLSRISKETRRLAAECRILAALAERTQGRPASESKRGN